MRAEELWRPFLGTQCLSPVEAALGMGAPLECAACSKEGELREMEFHPNGSHLPVPAQPLPAEGAGLVPSCPAPSGLGAPRSGLPTLP